MKRKKNYSLLHNNTFGIDQKCDEFITFESMDDAVVLARELGDVGCLRLPILILGGGSNLLLTKDFQGRVVTADKRFEVQKIDGDADSDAVFLRCWAGTTFDEVVDYAVKHEWCGMENLSLIPGECGASAVQNIGAYGVEAKDIISMVEAVEMGTGNKVTFTADECGYAYRQSRFKREWKGKYIITYVTYRLSRTFCPRLDYGNIRKTMTDRGIDDQSLTIGALRSLIIDIRRAKLPEPSDLGNAGSFFMNPIVNKAVFEELRQRVPDLKFYEVEASSAFATDHVFKSAMQYKIPAGWLIDRCGWRGSRMGNAGVYDKQALVLVNHGGATGEEIVNLMHAIQEDVFSKFGIHIYPEVNII